MTKKGKGYKPAEINPSVYHGVGKFDKEVGVIQSSVSPKTYSKILGEKLLLMAAYNKNMCYNGCYARKYRIRSICKDLS